MNETIPTIKSASVRVLRSFDYCHFEISLSSEYEAGEILVRQVDELRKEAARLADKAVEQYKIAKGELEKSASDDYQGRRLNQYREKALSKPESERTPFDKAALKKWNDHEHYQRRQYNYADDWDHQEDFDYEINQESDVAF